MAPETWKFPSWNLVPQTFGTVGTLELLKPNQSEAQRLRLERLERAARVLDDSPVRRYSSRQKKACLSFFVWVACRELDQPKWATCAIGLDFRAVIATVAIEVMIELP